MAQQIINVGASANDGTGDSLRLSQQKANSNFTELYNNKVDKVSGKGLSTNDYTSGEQTKLAGIEDGAQVNVQADFEEQDPLSPSFILNKPESLIASLGYFHFNDLATQTTPLVVLPNIEKKLTNDTLGGFTNYMEAPNGVAPNWDTDTNSFYFNDLVIGDTVDLRVDLLLTTTSANQNFKVFIRIGEGSPSEYDLLIFTGHEKTILTDANRIGEVSFSIDYQDHIDNPASIYIVSDDDATVKVNGWFERIFLKSVNMASFDDAHLKAKLENTIYNEIVLSGADAEISIQANGQSLYEVTNVGLTSLVGFNKSMATAVIYDGKDLFIQNKTGATIVLKHESGTPDSQFSFNSGVNFNLENNTTAWFRYFEPISLFMGVLIDADVTGFELLSNKQPTPIPSGVGTEDLYYSVDAVNIGLSKTKLLSASNGGAFFDDFDRTDRTLHNDLSLSGGEWTVSGAGASTCKIINNELVSDTAAGNFYASANVGETVKYVAGAYSFRTGESGTGPTLIITETRGGLTNMWHLQIGKTMWQLDKWIGGVITLGLMSGVFTSEANTIYGVAIEVDYVNNKVIVYAPDGSIREWVDSDVATFTSQAITLQCYFGIGKWHAVNTQKTRNKQINALGLSAPVGMITPLIGVGLSRVNNKKRNTVNGAGWYRILTKGSSSTFEISGTLFLVASHTGGGSLSELKIRSGLELSKKLIQAEIISNSASSPISKIRISVATGNEIYLDVYVSETTNNVNLDWDFRGIGTSLDTAIFNPTVGDLYNEEYALTNNLPLTFPNGVAFSRQQNNYTLIPIASGIGWYRILTHESFQTNWISGIVKISARNTAQSQYWEFDVACIGARKTTFKHIKGVSNTGSIITKARMSTNGASTLALDIYLGTVASDCNLWIEYEGLGVLQNATVGAVSLGSNEIEDNFRNYNDPVRSEVLSTGATTTIEAGLETLVNSNTATIATHTLDFKTPTLNLGRKFKFISRGNITTLNITITGFTIINPITTIKANEIIFFDFTNNTEVLLNKYTIDSQLGYVGSGTAPATATSTGIEGEIRKDADYIYVCTATNTWKRVSISTW